MLGFIARPLATVTCVQQKKTEIKRKLNVLAGNDGSRHGSQIPESDAELQQIVAPGFLIAQFAFGCICAFRLSGHRLVAKGHAELPAVRDPCVSYR